MNQSKANKIRTGLEDWVSSIFTILGRLFIGALVVAVFVMLYKGLSNDAYLIQAFQVPGDFEDKGYNGVVLSRKVQDRVVSLKNYIASSKEDEIDFEAELEPDLEVGVMGFGLSLNTVTYHLKSLLGRKNKIITGELTDLNNKMELTVRMSGFKTEYHVIEYEKDADEAIDYLLEEAAKTILKNTDPYRLAVYYYQKKDNHKALQVITSLLNKGEETEWAYLAWGNLLIRDGRTEEAMEKWKKAIEINPNFDNPKIGMAWAHIRKKEFGEASLFFEKLIEKDPENFSGWSGLARCYGQLKNKEKAIEAYDKCIEIMPDKIWGYANKAEYLMWTLKDTAGATFLFQKAAEVTPDGIDKYLSLAAAYEMMGDEEKSMEYINKVLEIDPNNFRGINSKINTLGKAKRYKEALANLPLVRALDTDGDKLYEKQTMLNSMAMVAYRAKDYQQMLVLAKESIGLDPKMSLPYTSLAEAYSMLGKDALFYEAIEKAFKYGFLPQFLLEDLPYKRFLKEKRFMDLVEQYSPKTTPLDQVAEK